MRSGRYMEDWDTKPVRRIPSLVDLCVQKAVDNVRYLRDVGETDQHLLERILPHCDVDQLKQIEDSTEDRDLSPITDKLWKNFYTHEFGSKNTAVVVDRMKEKKVSFKWRQLYEAKQKDMKEAEDKSIERIKQIYKTDHAQRQSRSVQLCTKVPPSSNKRSFWGGSGINLGNNKSGIMKKAKLEFINSREVKNLSAMKRTTMFSNNSATAIKKPIHSPGKFGASSSKIIAPPRRRF